VVKVILVEIVPILTCDAVPVPCTCVLTRQVGKKGKRKVNVDDD